MDGPRVYGPDPAWTVWRYDHGETIYQRDCPACDHGLIYAPVRFCGRCGGSGYLTSKTQPAPL